MKTLLAVMLASSVALADSDAGVPLESAPVDASKVPTIVDAPLANQPGVSVYVLAGDVAPFSGRLLNDQESERRAKLVVSCQATLADAEKNVLLPKPVVAVLISVAAAAVVSSVTLGIAMAAKK